MGSDSMIERFRTVKEITAALLFVGSLVAGGTLTFYKLQAKPSRDDMRRAIAEHRREEVHDQTQDSIEAIDRNINALQRRTERMEKVQAYILESLAWQGDVLEHLANKRRGAPPRRPDNLRKLERELMR